MVTFRKANELLTIEKSEVWSLALGTLRYAAAGCYYGYFCRERLGCQLRSLKPQTVKISLYGNGVFSIYVSEQKWIRSTLFYFHMTKA